MTFLRRMLGAGAAFVLSSWSAGVAADAPAWRDEWPRFRNWEYAVTLTAAAGGAAARFLAPDPAPNWKGGILFDDAVSDRFGVRHEPTRVALSISTHLMAGAAVAYRLADSTLVPGLEHDDWDLAEQMLLIDAESYALMLAVLYGTQMFVGRERPIVRRCGEPEVARSDRACDERDSQRNRSFIAGHTALGFTAAGLTCAHHANLELYGGSADAVACAAALGWASLLGIGRVITDNHYATDSLLGAALGLAAGWLLPLGLHYGFDGNDESTASTSQTLRRELLLPVFAYGGAF